MSSTPYIEIDWSSVSQHPYPQLGDSTPPENDSNTILHDTERPTVLSAKDILSLDIDDIYPYTYSTLHLNDEATEEFYDDEDYFQQLLETQLNAEIEEVSYGGNDIPPVCNTPLTPIQDTTPLPPLATAPLSENLRTTGKKTTLLINQNWNIPQQISLITNPLTPIYYITDGLMENQNVLPLDDWVFHMTAIFMLEILLQNSK
ncbi:unnamed protein product [Rhizophagus irregularis]|nr:unnamed protein product [Rhizophagus irregularis]